LSSRKLLTVAGKLPSLSRLKEPPGTSGLVQQLSFEVPQLAGRPLQLSGAWQVLEAQIGVVSAQGLAALQVPFAPQGRRLLPEHCVCVGSQLPTQLAVVPKATHVLFVHLLGDPYCPLAPHVRTPLLEQSCCPGEHTPLQSAVPLVATHV
jgi:hypothetical protein